MGSKRHLAEPGRRRVLLARLGLGLAALGALSCYKQQRDLAEARWVALEAAERRLAQRDTAPLFERRPSAITPPPLQAIRRLVVAEADTLAQRSIPLPWPPAKTYDGAAWRSGRLAAPPIGVGDHTDTRAAVRRLDAAQPAFRAARKRVRDAEFFGSSVQAAAFVTKRLAEFIGLGARKSCLLGDTRADQLRTLQRTSHARGRARMAVGVVAYDALRDYPGLDHLKAVALSAAKDGGFPEGLFAFTSVDAPTHAALCSVGLPAVAASEDVAEEGLAIVKRAFRDAALRTAARSHRRLRAADLADADAFEALLEGSTLADIEESDDIQAAPVQVQAKVLRGAPLDANAKNAHAARFQVCADLAFLGVDALAFDVDGVFFAPSVEATSARAGLDAAVRRKPPRRPANPELLVAALQADVRRPCLPLVVAKATNSTAWALHRLAGLARIAPTREHLQRAVAATLGLGSSDRGRLEADEVVCGGRPHFGGLDIRSSRLAAVVLDESPPKGDPGSLGRARAAMGRRVLALELGFVPPPPVEDGVLVVDAGPGLSSTLVVDASSTLKAVRLVVAHAIAACLETNRHLQLPALMIGERTFFLWTYLDLKSAEDIGLKWRPTHSLTGGNASLISADDRTVRLATDDARDASVIAFALPPGATAGRAVLDLAQLHRPRTLHLHLPFLALPRIASKHADALAIAVLAELRWCPSHLSSVHDARVATAAASCWGRGTAVA